MNNAARHSRLLFPLILGNSRTALAACTRNFSTTQALGIEELEIKLDENPFYHKYTAKIKQLKETNPTEYYKRIEAIRKASEKTKQDGPVEESEKRAEPELNVQRQRKSLDSILKIELVKDRLPSEITELWKSYYEDKNAVYAVILSETYKKLSQLRKANPTFIYPLPRESGYEMFLGQFSDDDCHFTSLIQYQRYQENAPVQLVINHYTELQKSKGIVLMSGITTDKSLSVRDAQLLSYQMQYFYDEENYQMVKDFTESPKNFDYNRVIECIGSQLLLRQTVLK